MGITPSALNLPAPEALNLLLSRRSAKAAGMTGPGPAEEEIDIILTAGSRTPDHGKLAPWRFILFEGEARARFGRMLVDVLAEDETVSPAREAQETGRLLRAPLAIGVVSRVRGDTAIPEWEQILSAGAACQNILLAAHALGYVATWLTEWFAYDARVRERLGLDKGERIAGFIHIGRSAVPLTERPRPELSRIVSRY